VDWYAKSTVGNIKFDSEDRESRSVYDYPNPPAYSNCAIGQPAALEHSYVNYVQAVPQSLFADKASEKMIFQRKYQNIHVFTIFIKLIMS